ncbi:hypothetical protein E7744_02725 [Citricoccus sp. SGAir0253]|uniref:hypothetical protein n=1 Tax=Citricoccus sp. SGAir0253 TaxID=2567881 RepID=UPI0010CCDCBC|nr:hypothetical protein [Citricoccus sp. SGAir0253]QCU77251.1 hypothetical protein E7744_02725 [Citricoccus sp. SGAir0253]
MTTRHPARLALAGTALAGAVLLAACSAPAGPAASSAPGSSGPASSAAAAPTPATADPHGTAGASAPSSGPGDGTGPAGASGDAAADARADQRAVRAASERAASFGFTNQVAATDEEIARTREENRLRRANTAGTTVDPARCKAPLTAVDWSPILLPDADASRVDFGSEGFAGTGTVEVAAVEDPRVVREHLADVERLVADCPELRMTVTDQDRQRSTFDFTARDSAADADSALVWTRTPAGGGAATTAQVLISQAGGHVVMVSFLGRAEVAGEEFTTIAEQLLAAAEGAL